MTQRYEHWIEQIKHLCSTANLRHIDVVVDQAAGDSPLLQALEAIEPPIRWFSLFSGTPEEALLDQAPILMRLSLDDWRHTAWLEEVVEHFGPLPCLLLLISPMPFDVLAKSLQGMSQLEWGGQSGLLRFYDPRVLPLLLSSVLDDEQRERFMQVAVFFSWLNRDQCPVWQPGSYRSGQEQIHTSKTVALSDAQFDRLGSISDAHKLMDIANAQWPDFSKEQCFSQCYRLVAQSSRENYFGDLRAYAKLQFVRMPSLGRDDDHNE